MRKFKFIPFMRSSSIFNINHIMWWSYRHVFVSSKILIYSSMCFSCINKMIDSVPFSLVRAVKLLFYVLVLINLLLFFLFYMKPHIRRFSSTNKHVFLFLFAHTKVLHTIHSPTKFLFNSHMLFNTNDIMFLI